jgi:hypothetical protein
MRPTMVDQTDTGQTICNRLQELGYARENNIKLYGEKLHLVSNPVPDGEGFAVDGIASASGKVRRMRIPLSLICTLRKELALDQ